MDITPHERAHNWHVQIERIEVQGGFLAGLDIEFRPGLNVLIGERGTGKTSVIELIRYCLGIGWFTEEARTSGHQQAIAILEDGEVTVTVCDGNERLSVTRTASGSPHQVSPRATVLAQNEVEAIGAQAGGRLHLVDRFRTNLGTDEAEPIVVARLKAATAEIQGSLDEIDNIDERILQLAEVPSQLATAIDQQTELLLSVEATEAQREQLEELQKRNSQLSVRGEVLEAAVSQITRYSEQLDRLGRTQLALDLWPNTAGEPDLLASAREELAELSHSIEDLAAPGGRGNRQNAEGGSQPAPGGSGSHH
jgi:DNA repair ATPase RecN